MFYYHFVIFFNWLRTFDLIFQQVPTIKP